MWLTSVRRRVYPAYEDTRKYHEQWHIGALVSVAAVYNAVLNRDSSKDDVDDVIEFCGNVGTIVDDDLELTSCANEDLEPAASSPPVLRGDDRESIGAASYEGLHTT